MDKITQMMTDMVSEQLFINSGTPVVGDVSESDYISIKMEE